MHMKRILSTVALAALTLASACSEAPAVAQSPPVVIASNVVADVGFVPTRLYGDELDQWKALDGSQRADLLTRYAQASQPLSDTLRDNPTPENIAPLARAMEADLDGTPYATVARQTASDFLLRSHLLQADPDVDQVARHADVLLSTRHPDARVLAEAIAVLEGSWSAERLAEARQIVRDAARVPSLGKACDEGCSVEQLARQMADGQSLTALERFEINQALALARL